MNFLITGGTGFIGTKLRTQLLRDGHHATVITRLPGKYEEESAQNQQFVNWDTGLAGIMDEIDVVINLVGENLFGKRWTEETKKILYDSRIKYTNRLVEAIEMCSDPPEVFISASAVDYYGDCGNEKIGEEHPPGEGFLADLCTDWEEAALAAREHGVRVAIPRLGIVLELGGGALGKMLLPFKLYIGGAIGDGQQYFPWLHMDDLCRGIQFAIEEETLSGPYNLCSPNPVTMDEFANTLGEVLKRPSFFRVPEFAIRLVLGEAADPILHSKKVYPRKLREKGFEFHFTELNEAFADIV